MNNQQVVLHRNVSHMFHITAAENGFVVELQSVSNDTVTTWIAQDADELGRVVLSALASERLT